ncbi:MAG: phosphoadenylyl-sulfate reductase [Salinarimonadaceae bacterium]|nr:MAG: phosphoadenylyl-sulfate reductase [Salinarimonadaceae bacterium]
MTFAMRDRALDVPALAAALKPLGLADRLAAARAALPGRLVFTTSFGLEDQLVTHAILTRRLDIAVVTLDTGRLFPQTYDVWSATEQRYCVRIPALYPQREALEALVADQGIDGFRNGVAERLACCGARKVEPLGRALDGASGWITGLRSGGSANREATPLAERDEARGLVKINPLADVSRETIVDHVRALEIPYNALHDRGFPSIGCAPCTRAVRLGEEERAGRWWWERESAKECGLHVRQPDAPAGARAS